MHSSNLLLMFSGFVVVFIYSQLSSPVVTGRVLTQTSVVESPPPVMTNHTYCIGGLLRNEGYVVLELIKHHMNLGFNRFIIFDDQSDDGTSEILQEWRSLFPVPISLHKFPFRHVQVQIANEILILSRRYCDWLAIIDSDEFIEMSHVTILDELAEQIVSIKMPWLTYGGSGFYFQPVSVRDSFNRRRYFPMTETVNVKNLFRPKEVGAVYVHQLETRGLTVGPDFLRVENQTDWLEINETLIPSLKIWIRHLQIQSYTNFYTKKIKRGSAMVVNNPRVLDSWNWMDEMYSQTGVDKSSELWLSSEILTDLLSGLPNEEQRKFFTKMRTLVYKENILPLAANTTSWERIEGFLELNKNFLVPDEGKCLLWSSGNSSTDLPQYCTNQDDWSSITNMNFFNNSLIQNQSNLISITSRADMYDKIILSHVLERVPFPIDLIKNFVQMLKVGGKLFLSLYHTHQDDSESEDYYRYTSCFCSFVDSITILNTTDLQTYGTAETTWTFLEGVSNFSGPLILQRQASPTLYTAVGCIFARTS